MHPMDELRQECRYYVKAYPDPVGGRDGVNARRHQFR
jgi:hypothetical protein